MFLAKRAELVKAFFECVPVFLLSHACIVRDLTPIVTIDRRVRLPLSKWRGHGVGLCSWQNGQNLSRLSLSVCQHLPYPTRLGRNRQSPANFLLGRGSTALENCILQTQFE